MRRAALELRDERGRQVDVLEHAAAARDNKVHVVGDPALLDDERILAVRLPRHHLRQSQQLLVRPVRKQVDPLQEAHAPAELRLVQTVE